MVKLDEIIGDVIFVSFVDMSKLKDVGIDSSCGHYLLKGYDQVGIWLEHPGLVVKGVKGSENKEHLESKGFEKNIIANFIVTWGNINTLMHYPGREGFDFENEFDTKIGFEINTSKKYI